MLDEPDFRALQEVMNSPEVRDYIVTRYQGAVLPAF